MMLSTKMRKKLGIPKRPRNGLETKRDKEKPRQKARQPIWDFLLSLESELIKARIIQQPPTGEMRRS